MRHPFVVAAGLVEAAVLLFVTHRVLPVHVVWVDAWLTVLAVFRAATVLAFAVRPARARARVFVIAGLIASLVSGMLAATALAVSAATVAGVYDAVGDGAAVFFTASALFVLPYLVLAPAVGLHSLLRSDLRDAAA